MMADEARVMVRGGQITGVHFCQAQPEGSFACAWRLLFNPDAFCDQEDGLPMLTEPDRAGRLSTAEKECPRVRLKQRGASPFLKGYRELFRGDHTPLAEQFWWQRDLSAE